MSKIEKSGPPLLRLPKKSADFEVSGRHWQDLAEMDPEEVCARSGASIRGQGMLSVPFLGRDVLLDVNKRKIRVWRDEGWEDFDDPLLELVCLLYLLGAGREGVIGRLVGPAEMKEGHFFQGIHALPTARLEAQYGRDPEGFSRAGARMGADPEELGDAAFSARAFPKVPITYILWAGDEQFPARVSILFDASVEKHFQADGILGVAQRVSREIR